VSARTPPTTGDFEGDPGQVEEWAILQTERDLATMAANEQAYQESVYQAADRCAQDEERLSRLGLPPGGVE